MQEGLRVSTRGSSSKPLVEWAVWSRRGKLAGGWGTDPGLRKTASLRTLGDCCPALCGSFGLPTCRSKVAIKDVWKPKFWQLLCVQRQAADAALGYYSDSICGVKKRRGKVQGWLGLRRQYPTGQRGGALAFCHLVFFLQLSGRISLAWLLQNYFLLCIRSSVIRFLKKCWLARCYF